MNSSVLFRRSSLTQDGNYQQARKNEITLKFPMYGSRVAQQQPRFKPDYSAQSEDLHIYQLRLQEIFKRYQTPQKLWRAFFFVLIITFIITFGIYLLDLVKLIFSIDQPNDTDFLSFTKQLLVGNLKKFKIFIFAFT